MAEEYEYLLTLYVSGATRPVSTRAITNLQRLCEEEFGGRCGVEIIDVVEQPQAAEDANIIATPLLVRAQPAPPSRVIGDLSDTARVLKWLGVRSHVTKEHRP